MVRSIVAAKLVPSQNIFVSPIRSISSHSLLRQAYAQTPLNGYPLSPSQSELKPVTILLKPPPLSILSLTSLIRSIAINTVSSSPILLPLSLKALSILANAHSPFLNPDQNFALRWFLKKTFYAQFCAGENAKEVSKTVTELKSIGFRGVMLCYAKEVVLDEKASQALGSSGDRAAAKSIIHQEIVPWKKGTLETVAMMGLGDFVAVKFTGAGSQALYDLSRSNSPSPALKEAIDEICDLAASRGVRLAFDAEQQSFQAGIFNWTLEYMRKYNKGAPGQAVVYCTYQCYLKAAAEILAGHLSTARKEGFTLGVKLVRGAYLASDPRHLLNDTKTDTDRTYDGLAESVITKKYGPVLRPAAGEADQAFPSVSLALACHNLESVRKAQAIHARQAQKGEPRIEMVYAQLQGMADEVSCELVQAARAGEAEGERRDMCGVDIPQAYKYLVWGTTGECMKYLLRRAQENRDAVQRTREARNLMVVELARRMRLVFGWGA